MASSGEVAALFRKFDKNHDGAIDMQELKEVFQTIDPATWTDERVESLMRQVDADRDNKIRYNEFVEWIFSGEDDCGVFYDVASHIQISIEDALAQYLTWARTKPHEVLAELRQRLRDYNGKEYSPSDQPGRTIETKEGKAACEDAIRYLQRQEPLQGVGNFSVPGLALAAEDHVWDIGQTGTASHDSSDGMGTGERAALYGAYGMCGECLWYGGPSSTARHMILDLIVDDGVATRGHRHCIYNPAWNAVGCAYGPHSIFQTMSAMSFARNYTEDPHAVARRMEAGPRPIDAETLARAKRAATTQWNLGTCAVCKEPIRGGRVVEVKEAGGKLHKDCFKCTSCSTNLSGVAFNMHGGALFCSRCYGEQHAERCQACGEPLTRGAIANCSLGKFHVDCLVCSECHKAIGKNRFDTSAGTIRCKACADASGARLVGAGGRGVAGGRGGGPGSGAPVGGFGAGAAGGAKATPSTRNSSRVKAAAVVLPAVSAGRSPSPRGAQRNHSGVSSAPAAATLPAAPAARAARNSPAGAGGRRDRSPAKASSPARGGAPKAKPKATPKSLSAASAAIFEIGADYANL